MSLETYVVLLEPGQETAVDVGTARGVVFVLPAGTMGEMVLVLVAGFTEGTESGVVAPDPRTV